MTGRQAISIFGPTASGKSALALGLALRLGGEIVNADSRQVYRQVQRVTMGPSATERAQLAHHLFDFIDPRETYSAGRWAADAVRVIEDILARGRVPIVVGGTGFSLKALLDGLNGVPEVPQAVTGALATRPREALWAELKEVDPVLAARMAGTAEARNPQRLVRALAVFTHTGVPLSSWQDRPGPSRLDVDWLRVGLSPPREVLAARIAQRWKETVGDVLVEMHALRMAGIAAEAPGLQGLAVVAFMDFIDGNVTLDEALTRATLRDVQYAKRQRTWLRTQYRADMVLETVDAAAVEKLFEDSYMQGT